MVPHLGLIITYFVTKVIISSQPFLTSNQKTNLTKVSQLRFNHLRVNQLRINKDLGVIFKLSRVNQSRGNQLRGN